MAPRTVTQRIAFEGGDQMKIQLQDLGEAGTTAFRRIKQAADDASSMSRLVPVIDAIKERLTVMGTAASNLKQHFGDMEQAGQKVITRFTAMGVAVVGLVAGFAKLVESSANAAEEIEKGAAAAGLSTDRYQSLKNAFTLAGVGGDQFGGLMNKLNKAIGTGIKANEQLDKSISDLYRQYSRGKISQDALTEGIRTLRENAEEAITAFSELGLHVTDFGNDPERALKKVLQAIDQMPPGINRARIEMELFGRAGTTIDRMVHDLVGFQRAADALIPKLTDVEIATGVRLRASITVLTSVLDVLRQKFFLAFGPAITALIDSITAYVSRHQEALQQFAEKILETLVPIIHDIRALLAGQDIDPTGFVAQLIQGFEAFAAGAKIAIAVVVAAWNGLVDIMNVVAKYVNKVFGTDFTGTSLAVAAAILTISGAFTLVGTVITTLIAIVGVLDAALVLAFGPAGAAIAGIVLLGLAIGALIAQIPGVQEAFNAVVDYITTTVQNFATLFKLIGAAWQLVWQEMADYAKSIINAIVGWLQPIIDLIKRVASAFGGASGGTNAANASGGYAQGGHIRGPGTSRSDSILARLSTGEHVTQAAAVQYYGTRFMDAINSMSIPRSVLEGLAGFANGGLVRSLAPMSVIPGFANGGLVANVLPPSSGVMGRPFTLQIGGDTITGLSAEHASVERLQRLAAKKHVAQAGVKPSWFT